MKKPAGPDAIRLRPAFRLRVDLPREEAIVLLRTQLARSRSKDCWKGKGRWCEIHVPENEQRIWSPHLSLRLDDEEGGSSIFGRFAPKPEVWTFFVSTWPATWANAWGASRWRS